MFIIGLLTPLASFRIIGLLTLSIPAGINTCAYGEANSVPVKRKLRHQAQPTNKPNIHKIFFNKKLAIVKKNIYLCTIKPVLFEIT